MTKQPANPDTGTNAQDKYYTNPYGKNISDNQFVAYIQKTF